MYHQHTRATFNPLDREVARALLKFAAQRSAVGRTIELGGRVYTLEHISRTTSAFWRSRGLSIYFRSGRSVVRISDHWSQSRHHRRSRKLNCGHIASCFWSIRNRADDAMECYDFGGKYPYKMIAGICGLNGFKKAIGHEAG